MVSVFILLHIRQQIGMAGYRVWYTWLCTYDEDRGDDVTCILMARKGPKEGTLAITLSIERSDPDAMPSQPQKTGNRPITFSTCIAEHKTLTRRRADTEHARAALGVTSVNTQGNVHIHCF